MQALAKTTFSPARDSRLAAAFASAATSTALLGAVVAGFDPHAIGIAVRGVEAAPVVVASLRAAQCPIAGTAW
jgi:hypothetical protein